MCCLREAGLPLPRDELTTLFIAVADAVDHAHKGDLAGGYTLLLAGLQRARKAHADEEPWGEELIGRYRDAMDRYLEYWGEVGQTGGTADPECETRHDRIGWKKVPLDRV
jgi:hypothetical protein